MAGAVERAIDPPAETAEEVSEVRLCLESLTPLLADHPSRTVRTALERIDAALSRVGALGHTHLAVDPEHAVVAEVASPHRCVLELARTADGLRHRWHFDERDATTDWYPLPGEPDAGP